MANTPSSDTEAARPAPVKPWASLSIPDFRYFWAGVLFSNVSRFMRETLSYFLIYEISGSAVQLGLTGLFQAVPVIVLGLIGGSLADAVDRKKLLAFTYSVGIIWPFILAALIFTDSIAVWHLWVMSSFTAGLTVIGNPAQRSFLPRLVPRSYLMNGVTMHSAASQGSLLLGPLLAGAVAPFVGFAAAFVLNGILQVVALATIFFVRTPGLPEGQVKRRAVSLTAIVDGLVFIKSQRLIWAGFLIDFGVMAAGYYRILLPVVGRDMFDVGVTGVGILTAAPAIGSVIATAALLAAGDIKRKGVLIVLSYFLFAVFVVMLGLSPWFWVGVIASVGLGFADMSSYTARQTVTQLVAPDDFRGRTAATSQIAANVANTTGAMQIGFVTALIGVSGALVLGGAVGMALTVVVTLKVRDLWRYRG